MSKTEHRIRLDCVRTENGLLIYQGEKKRMPVEDLKHRLFAWHEPSFYGTLLEVSGGSSGGHEGILLPELMTPRYWAEGIHDAAIEVAFSPRLAAMLKAAPILLRCLMDGHYAPDYASWRNGRTGWRLLPEEGEDASVWSEALAEALQAGDRMLVEQWPTRYLNALANGDIQVKAAWENTTEAYPLLQAAAQHQEEAANGAGLETSPPSGFIADEEDWHILIGWKKDEVPFRVALRLAEPGTADDEGQLSESWVLDTVLLDRDDPSVRLVWQDWMERQFVQAGYGAHGEQAGLTAVAAEETATLEAKDAALTAEETAASAAKVEALTEPGAVEAVPPSWLPGLKERVVKERQRWLTAVPGLDGGDGRPVKAFLQENEVWSFLAEDSLKLASAGASILLPSWWETVRQQRVRLKAKVRSSVGAANSMFGMDAIIQFDWRVALGETQLSEAEFLRLAEEKKRLFQVNGQWVLLDPSMLEAIRKVMKRMQKKKGLTFREAMELHLLGGTDIGPGDGTEETRPGGEADEGLLRLEVELNGHLSSMLGQLQQTSTIPLLQDPAGFHGELRRYQREGVSWMAFLQRFGLGGCLADDMGLGKTVQWIVYLLHLKEGGGLDSPALLICPTSVIGNWQKELERFAPGLRVQVHYGSRRAKGEEFLSSVSGADVVITSYTLAHLDEEMLSGMQWSSLCLDEAQNIKNAYTKQAGAIRSLNARHRIALTGTPIENRLTELWSIFDYVNPGYLGSLGEFRRNFVNEVEKGNAVRIGQVQRLVRPFLLRRLKKDPAIQLDLPEKNEMKTFVPLTAVQGALYESVLQDLFAKIDTLAPMERRGLILATLTRLKQVCDHPVLLEKKNADGDQGGANEGEAAAGKVRRSRSSPAGRAGRKGNAGADQSAKLSRLLEMVDELRGEGDKCLIFTQFVEMGHLLQSTLAAERGETVLFLHGGVPKAKRDEMIARFQEETDAGIFVLSLKAGGTGLNLTAANHVFHFDRWWNPAVENQATDRAFRIGQTRDVQVHKFISLGTLEERIDQMIDKKQGLNQQIIGGGENWITEMSTDELRELFALRREWMDE